MAFLDELEEAGVDTKAALARFRNDEELFQMLLVGFLEDMESYDVASYLDSGDFDTARDNAHALKGASGNLGLDVMYNMYKDVNDLLKEGNNEEAVKVFYERLPAQQKIVEVIKKYEE